MNNNMIVGFVVFSLLLSLLCIFIGAKEQKKEGVLIGVACLISNIVLLFILI